MARSSHSQLPLNNASVDAFSTLNVKELITMKHLEEPVGVTTIQRFARNKSNFPSSLTIKRINALVSILSMMCYVLGMNVILDPYNREGIKM